MSILGRLGPHFGLPCTHMEGGSEFYEKTSRRDLGNGVSAAEDFCSGARVKAHVLEKASLIPRENGIPATWRKRGPLGKGNY